MPNLAEKLAAKFREYRKEFPKDHDDRIWAAVGEYFASIGEGPETLAARKNACTANNEWSPHHLSYAKALIQAHQWMKAVGELEACGELECEGLKPEQYEESDLYYLGYALFGAKRFKEASEAWRAASNRVRYWGEATPLKLFHQHRGWAHHLERDFLDAIDAYKRALIAPGPGDTEEDDAMDADAVEAAQDQLNPAIERDLELAHGGELLDPDLPPPMPFSR